MATFLGNEVAEEALCPEAFKLGLDVPCEAQNKRSCSLGMFSIGLSCRKLEGVDSVNLKCQCHMQMCLSESQNIGSGLIEIGFLELPYN